MTALLDRYGAETVSAYMDELITYTDRRTRAELAKLRVIMVLLTSKGWARSTIGGRFFRASVIPVA